MSSSPSMYSVSLAEPPGTGFVVNEASMYCLAGVSMPVYSNGAAKRVHSAVSGIMMAASATLWLS